MWKIFCFCFKQRRDYLASHLLHKSTPETHHPLKLHCVLTNQEHPTVWKVVQASEICTIVLNHKAMEGRLLHTTEQEEGGSPQGLCSFFQLK